MSMSSTSLPPPLLSEDHTNDLPMAWHLPEASKSCSPTELAFQWTRVPRHQLLDGFIAHAHFHQPATAADLPTELCYMVLKFLSLGTCYKTRIPHYRHDCKEEAECTRQYISCDWQELCQIALREDLKMILANLDSVHRYTSSRRISGKPDLVEHLRMPWIHQISLRVLPALNIPTGLIELLMDNSEPFPEGQTVSSIHKALPRRLPRFSSSIQTLNLKDVHFKRFDHLVRLIKEMPSVQHVKLTRVTWDPQSLVADQMPQSTSFLEREDPEQRVGYWLEDCTDNRAARWLVMCVGLTREDVLDQNDARSLWAIVLTLPQFDRSTPSERGEVNEIDLDPFDVFLTPRAGIRQKRRARAVAVDLENRKWSLFDWGEIDRQLASLGALEVALLRFSSYDSLCEHHNSIRTSFPCLKRRPRVQLKLIFEQGLDSLWEWRQASLTEDGVDVIDEPVRGGRDGWKEFL
ncbi:hypothetical protein NM688_g6054 [Phlebia brevispora]|uniref:Uncharacterized protein n=1 Tax=Phlebia brevispora TaxID=194682 RepID=A0ACC1SKT1_9APHY|nr:hypothetical protein NM688_g6054 [Phlebia brevispora]